MVILNNYKKHSFDFEYYLKFKNLIKSTDKRITFEIKLFEYCEVCFKMAALPHGAFAAAKMRQYSQRDMTLAKIKNTADKSDTKSSYANKKLMEYSPVKYNSKLMNSIWGLYNRYSPHNIKSNDNEISGNVLQQPLAVASYTIAQNLSMAFNSGNEWKFGEK